MISKHLTILPAVAALLLSAGCSNDDMDGALADGPVAAQVTAAISDGQTVSRVSTDGDTPSFAAGDVINVVASGTDTYEYSLSDGTWSAVSSPYYFQDLSAVSFRGWYATVTPTDNSISIDTKTQTTTDGWNQWDILTAPAVSAYATSPTIDFTGDNAFSHIMSQVTLTFKAGNGVSDLTNLTGYALKDLTTDATFSTLTCELTAGSTTGDITQDIEASGTEYTCTPVILVPQEVSGKLSLEVTYNGLTYVTDLILPNSATAMTAGTHYAYNVNINNTGLTVSSAAIAEWTAADTESGSVTIPIKSGYTFTTDDNGTRTYTVYDEAGLLAWSEYTRSGHWATNCTLANDVTLTSEWTAVGTESNPYTGTFDGNDHTISGLTINATSNYQGLIGCLGSGGVVQNLMLAEVSIISTNYFVGGVVGRNEGGTVSNCSVLGLVSGNYFTGGVVGLNNGGTVTACYSTGEVSGDLNTGGVVGRNASGIVTACYFAGAVSSTGISTGGVVGFNSGTLNTCYWANSSKENGAATYGDGFNESNTNATKVDGTDVTWATAAETMNETLTSNSVGWQYVVNDVYDGTDTTVAPLLLEEVTE